MDMDRVRIADVITAEYSDFLSFCSASGKIFISELTNVDFVAFRTSSGQSRDYIKSIRAMLDNPVVVATTEVDAVRKGSESEKNELQGVLFDAGKYLALEDQSTPSKTESPSWIQPTEQPVKNLEAVLDETSCSDTENDTENETADRTTEEFVVTSIGTETTASSSTGPSDDSEYTLAYLFDVNPLWFEDVGIIALNLGVRPTNCLNNAKIKTIAEVLVRTTDELKAIKNMGAKSVNEIVQKVKDYVSDPANLDVETISAVSNHVSKHERVELDPAFKSTLEAKFNGPKGIGFLYVREGTPILPLLNGGAQENSLRAGTENVASIVGMATALSMNCSQIQKSQNHSAKMVELICSILNDAEVDYIRNGYSNGLKGTLNLSFRGKDGEAILHRLDLRGILVSTGSACDSNSVQVSHVIKAINVPDSYAKGTIRISLGKDNTIEEAKIIGETLVSVLMEQK